MKKNIIITKKIDFKEVNLLNEFFDIVFLNNYNEIFEENLNNTFGILSFVTDKIDKKDIEKLPDNLKIISNCAVGYNNIDIKTAKEKNITVTNTPDVLTNATADLTFALLLNISRKISAGEKMIHENNFFGWEPDMLLGTELFGKTLGIIGLGRIGLAVANRAKAFGMKIIYHNRNKRNEELDKNYNILFKEFDELIKESDFISIHSSLNESSKHLLTSKEFNMMKKTAFVINTARGECIKEIDLINALKIIR